MTVARVPREEEEDTYIDHRAPGLWFGVQNSAELKFDCPVGCKSKELMHKMSTKYVREVLCIVGHIKIKEGKKNTLHHSNIA